MCNCLGQMFKRLNLLSPSALGCFRTSVGTQRTLVRLLIDCRAKHSQGNLLATTHQGLQNSHPFPSSILCQRLFAMSTKEAQQVVESSAEGIDVSGCSPVEGDTNKRSGDEDLSHSKKQKLDNKEVVEDGEKTRPYKKKKVALLMVYSGKGYQGMQRNPGVHTIEDDLMTALVKAGVVTEDHASNPGMKMGFQRAARTDKGVSAAGQVCSLKLFIDVDNPVEKINSHLPDKIRVLGFIPTTKGFDAKNATSARTYMYILPTFAFCPFDQKITEGFRITGEIIEKINEVLSLYKGTHNFHNFTSGKKADDASARRYITDFSCSQPYIQEGLELAVIKVKGQSFMLHQIRKMIGLTIAMVKGLTDVDLIEKAWGGKKYDIPKAPGLGLVLDKVHYDHYNKKYGDDGMHQAISWEKHETEIEEFKKKFIYTTIIDTEKTEKSMLNWLGTLHLHHFSELKDVPSYESSPLAQASRLVQESRANSEKAEVQKLETPANADNTKAGNAVDSSSDKEQIT